MKFSLSPRDRLIAVAVGIVIVVAVLVVLLIVPQFQSMNALDAQIQAATQQAAVAKSTLEQRRAVKDRAASTEAIWLKLSNMVPSTPDMPALIIDLQDAAYDSGVQLESITPGQYKAATKEVPYSITPVSLLVWGSWSDSVDYMQRLLKLTRGIRVVSVQSTVMPISPASANPPLPTYSVSNVIAIEVYSIPGAITATGK